jgi:hypothetical protein
MERALTRCRAGGPLYYSEGQEQMVAFNVTKPWDKAGFFLVGIRTKPPFGRCFA